MLRVAHVITGLGSGGAEASLYRVLAAQPDPSRHVVISLTSRGCYADRLEAIGVRVFTLGLLRGELAVTALFRLHALFWKLRPDVTQAWMYHANVAATLARLTGAPTHRRSFAAAFGGAIYEGLARATALWFFF